MPITASTSGISSIISSLYRSARQPVTTMAEISPAFLYSAVSSMVSIASALADSDCLIDTALLYIDIIESSIGCYNAKVYAG